MKIGPAGKTILPAITAVLFISCADYPAHARAKVLREVHFDDSSVSISDVKQRYRILTEQGKTFKLPFQGKSIPPQISKTHAADGSYSLELSTGPSDAGQIENDRSEFTVTTQGDSDGLHLGQDRYLTFFIYIDPDLFPASKKEIIIAQVWQSFKSIPTGPVAFISMIPGSKDLRFRLATRNDSGVTSEDVALKFSQFAPKTWNSVILHLVPRALNDPRGQGLIEMWLNDEYLGNSNRAWGYSSSNSVDAFDVRIGIYANPGPDRHTLWIDRVQWSTDRAKSY